METKEISELINKEMKSIHGAHKISDLEKSGNDYIALIHNSNDELCEDAIIYHSDTNTFEKEFVLSLATRYPDIYG